MTEITVTPQVFPAPGEVGLFVLHLHDDSTLEEMLLQVKTSRVEITGSPAMQLQVIGSGIPRRSASYPVGGQSTFYLTVRDNRLRFISRDWRYEGSRGAGYQGRLLSVAAQEWIDRWVVAASSWIRLNAVPDFELVDASIVVANLLPRLQRTQTAFLALQAEYMRALDALAEVKQRRGVVNA